MLKELPWNVICRVGAALSCAIVAGIVGDNLMHLPWWSNTALVSDNATLVTFTFLAVIFFTQKDQ